MRVFKDLDELTAAVGETIGIAGIVAAIAAARLSAICRRIV